MLRENKPKFVFNLKNNGITAYLLAIAAFLSGWAALSEDTTLTSEKFRILGQYVFYCIVAMIFFSLIFKKIKPSIGILFSVVTYWAFEYIHVYDANYHTVGLVAFLLLIIFGLLSNDDRKAVFNYYKWIIVCMAAIGSICYFAFVLHFPLPYSTVPYYSAVGTYVNYGVSYILSAGALSRLCGLFNEPGYFWYNYCIDFML